MTGGGRSAREARVPAEIYVVSIYRRGSRVGMEVAGLVERIDGRERATFASRRELWAILCGKRLPAARRTRKGI